MEERVGIVGAGKLGGAFARALCEAGISVVAITDLVLARAMAKAKLCGDDTIAMPLTDLPGNLTALFVAVSDDAIAKVAKIVANSGKIHSGCVVAHTSGVFASTLLEPLQTCTPLIASFHPIQTFSGSEDDWKRFFGIYYGIEGTPQAIPRLTAIIDKLKGHDVVVPAEKKNLYHLGCVIASNFLVALQSAAAQIVTSIGVNEKQAFEILEPLVNATLDNIKMMGRAEALTGPIVRRDISTVKRHLSALVESKPELVPFYVTMSELVIDMIKGKEPEDVRLVELEQVLKDASVT